MNHLKKIVCDIDDTISFCYDRDFDNATPNTPLIAKLNDLYDKGWEICYFTARGSLSCSTLQQRIEKYDASIQKWFVKNNVKYSELSFEKPLASYYIDDKAITPEGFLGLDIYRLEGRSGASILKEGEYVVKEEKDIDTAIKVIDWYKKAMPYINVPKIHHIIGKTIKMEYIENEIRFNSQDLIEVKNVIDVFRSIAADVEIPFSEYITRINSHINSWAEFNLDIDSDTVTDMIDSYSHNVQLEYSFAHGDFSINNILCTDNHSIYLIDPIYEPETLPQSWELDVAKLMFSACLNGYDYVRTYFLNQFKNRREKLLFLEITQNIRVIKYFDGPEQLKAVEILKQRIKEFENEKN